MSRAQEVRVQRPSRLRRVRRAPRLVAAVAMLIVAAAVSLHALLPYVT